MFGEKDMEWLLLIFYWEMMVDSGDNMLKKENYLGKYLIFKFILIVK